MVPREQRSMVGRWPLSRWSPTLAIRSRRTTPARVKVHMKYVRLMGCIRWRRPIMRSAAALKKASSAKRSWPPLPSKKDLVPGLRCLRRRPPKNQKVTCWKSCQERTRGSKPSYSARARLASSSVRSPRLGPWPEARASLSSWIPISHSGPSPLSSASPSPPDFFLAALAAGSSQARAEVASLYQKGSMFTWGCALLSNQPPANLRGAELHAQYFSNSSWFPPSRLMGGMSTASSVGGSRTATVVVPRRAAAARAVAEAPRPEPELLLELLPLRPVGAPAGE
mmetsp:Transcript_38093/g.109918  ORF Transcript_38093/g.109918 Transcript_38093/m.109918 type:complete len:282 (-) Transcript_38093:22-867(-)